MKLVEINQYFEVSYGSTVDLNKLEVANYKDGVPYVGRSEKNNGITAYVKKVDSIPLNPGMTISVAGGGSVLSTFVQEKPFYSGYHLFVLTPKVPMNINELFYYATAIRQHKFRYSYGRQANKTLSSLKIPSIDNVSDKIKNYNMNNNQNIQEFETLNRDVKKSLNYINMHENVTIDELFTIVNGLSSSKVVIQEERIKGLIPYVRPSKWQSTSYAGYVNESDVNVDKVFPAGTLYISTDGAGSHTYAYVSVEKFVPNSNVSVLIPKYNMSLELKLIYATFITANRFKFSYGRKPKGKRLTSIEVPNLQEEYRLKSTTVNKF